MKEKNINDLFIDVAIIRCPATCFTAKKGGEPVHACMYTGRPCLLREGSLCKKLLAIIGDRSEAQIRAELLKALPWEEMKRLKEGMKEEIAQKKISAELVRKEAAPPKRTVKPRVKKRCECGNYFVVTSNRKERCDTCAILREREKTRERVRNHRRKPRQRPSGAEVEEMAS